MSNDLCFDETDPQTTIELVLHRIETGMTTEGDALWLAHYLRVKEVEAQELRHKVDIYEGFLQI